MEYPQGAPGSGIEDRKKVPLLPTVVQLRSRSFLRMLRGEICAECPEGAAELGLFTDSPALSVLLSAYKFVSMSCDPNHQNTGSERTCAGIVW